MFLPGSSCPFPFTENVPRNPGFVTDASVVKWMYMAPPGAVSKGGLKQKS